MKKFKNLSDLRFFFFFFSISKIYYVLNTLVAFTKTLPRKQANANKNEIKNIDRITNTAFNPISLLTKESAYVFSNSPLFKDRI